MDPGHTSNGHIDEQAVAAILQEETTVGYLPRMPLETLWLYGTDTPYITLRRDLEFMQMHPIVMTALECYKSGIATVKFWGGPDHSNPQNTEGKPISPDKRVAEFVVSHAERYWNQAMPLFQEGGYPYGWAAGEHIYKEVGGMLVWDYMKDFHPNDAFILSLQYQPVGVRIKNIRNRPPVDLWFSNGRVPAKAAWYPHRPKYNAYYGRSQLIGAWRPWRRLGWRDGYEQVLDAAVYRAGYKGPIVKHPMEDMQTSQSGIPATRTDGSGHPRRSARDVARQIVEWAKAGAGFTLPSTQYAPTQGGGPKWDIEWPDHVMDMRPLIEGARYLEDQIMLGAGVPPELIRAGGTGSGYSGRSIPREAFLQGQQTIADAMLSVFVEQVIRPLVLWNFGDVPFTIRCKSLIETQLQMQQGEQGGQDKQGGHGEIGQKNLARSQAAKDAWKRRNANKIGRGQAGAPSAGAQMGLNTSVEDMRDKVLAIIERVAKKAS